MLTARNNSPPKLGDKFIASLRNWGLSANPADLSSDSYAAVVRTGSVAFENASGGDVSYSDGKNGIRLDVSQARGYPVVRVNELDCSHAWIGLNVCVIDAATSKVTEIATFGMYEQNPVGAVLTVE